jgi:hypothetical protein
MTVRVKIYLLKLSNSIRVTYFIFIALIPGYFNSLVRSVKDVPKSTSGGACEKALTYILVNNENITPTSFVVEIYSEVIETFNSSFELYSLAGNAGDIEVKLNSKSYAITFSSSQPKVITVEDLAPGTKYRMIISTPEGVASQVLTTLCYCEIIGDDKSGKPTQVKAIQSDGYITFVFNDNSR